jgi:hypothetical protein
MRVEINCYNSPSGEMADEGKFQRVGQEICCQSLHCIWRRGQEIHSKATPSHRIRETKEW